MTGVQSAPAQPGRQPDTNKAWQFEQELLSTQKTSKLLPGITPTDLPRMRRLPCYDFRLTRVSCHIKTLGAMISASSENGRTAKYLVKSARSPKATRHVSYSAGTIITKTCLRSAACRSKRLFCCRGVCTGRRALSRIETLAASGQSSGEARDGTAARISTLTFLPAS